MFRILLVCLLLIAGGVYLVVHAPNGFGTGIALIVIPGMVAIQTVLLAIASLVRPTAGETLEPPEPTGVMERAGLVMHRYEMIRWFLARVVGWIAIIYAIVVQHFYFLGLGAALVVLFWVLDELGKVTPEIDGDAPFGARESEAERSRSQDLSAPSDELR